MLASICRRGHVIERARATPDPEPGFCETCGEAVLTACEKCERPISGLHYSFSPYVADAYRPPAYCKKCGVTLPWTEWAMRELEAVVDEDPEVPADEKAQLKQD